MVDAFFRQIITVIFSYRFFSKARALLFFLYFIQANS